MLVLAGVMSWSTAGLFTRIVTTDIPTTLLWRSLFGGLSVLVIFLIKPTSKAWRFSLPEIFTACLTAAGMLCFISAFFFTSIANVTFIHGLTPLLAYGMSIVFLKTKTSKLATLCCITSAIGVLTMTSGNSNLNDYIGICLALGMILFTTGMTIATKFYPNTNVIKITYLAAFLCAIAVAPFASYGNIAWSDYAWLALYGIANVGLGFGLYFLGVKRISAVAAALIILIEVPLAPYWAYLLFNEQPNSLILLGGVIVTLSALIYLINSARSK